MPLYLYYRPSFKRSLKNLGHKQKKIVGLILEALDAYYFSGSDLVKTKKIAPLNY